VPLTDAEAIADSLEDGASFGLVFERHHRRVWRYVAARAGADVADEVAAQTFEVAFDQRDRYRKEYEDAAPWLLGIATNLVRRQRRQEGARLRALARVDPGRPAPGADEELGWATELGPRAVVARAFQRLPRRDREVLALLAWGELTYEEAAVALGVAIGTIRSRAHRARARVRELLDAEGATTGEDS
jgi:RNA polymerase sigma-70 factor (ECF subfamily)